MSYGHFDDADGAYVITDPLPPRPWINYLGNRRLTAFLSQNAGGLLWYKEPIARRITRYQYTAAPADRPGFYLYIQDRGDGELWNPHFAPTCTPLDAFTCRVTPGMTAFVSRRNGMEADVAYGVPPADDVFLWRVRLTNRREEPASLRVASYMEFGLLEFLRETIGWCYLQHQFKVLFDRDADCIQYDYHVFEAPFAPRMVFGCTEPVTGFDCSRAAFLGPTAGYDRPAALAGEGGLTGSELPLGGHGCGALGTDVDLAPGETRTLAFLFSVADDWDGARAQLDAYRAPGKADAGLAAARGFWSERLGRFQVRTGDCAVDRFVNVWNPYNASVSLELARRISTDHMGLDGLRYRDTSQDALGVVGVDAAFARERMEQVFGQQAADGGGCMAFFPYSGQPRRDEPHRSDNTVWPVYTAGQLVAETGEIEWLEETIPYRDAGSATIYEHLLRGLEHIYEHRGPHGLPTLFHADWNDGLALFQDPDAESVMLGMQLVAACNDLAELANALGRRSDAEWCASVAGELTEILNSGTVWDGAWYRRLLLSSGKSLGAAANPQGRIYLNPQSWAVISGVGARDRRGRSAMDAAHGHLDSACGLAVLTPPFTGIPAPEDPPLGSHPGVGENGGIFCHANTWAIIAEALLGNGERAFAYYRQLLPESVARHNGWAHYGREPYVYVSSIVGPLSDRFGEAGISWLTGTASWMYVAVTQYILGLQPTREGLRIRPCLPKEMREVTVERQFRGCTYSIEIEHAGTGGVELAMDGEQLAGDVVPVQTGKTCRVRCVC